MIFTEQTGFRRAHPGTICQNHEYLLAVKHFDFDLSDPDFVAYFESRTGVQLRETGGYYSPRLRTDEEWDELVAHIESSTETSERILRGKLQDCWELYQKPVGEDEPPHEPNDCFRNVKRERLLADEVITASPGYFCPAW